MWNIHVLPNQEGDKQTKTKTTPMSEVQSMLQALVQTLTGNAVDPNQPLMDAGCVCCKPCNCNPHRVNHANHPQS